MTEKINQIESILTLAQSNMAELHDTVPDVIHSFNAVSMALDLVGELATEIDANLT